ncbi:MAG: hypothetical protein M3082_06905 [Candidatus Dormibacteraeota bacterium]|nr:hypothetical protein [Candidatus Dormibacteraeota bacterium]
MDSTVPRVHQLLEPAPFGLSLGSLVEEYLADCRRRGLSPKTVDYAYGYTLRQVFLPWCSRAASAILGTYQVGSSIGSPASS